MKRAIWIVMLVCVGLAGSSAPAVDLSPAEVVSDTPMESISAPPDCPGSWRAVRLHCRGGSQGVATGFYGGTDFFLVCNGDRGNHIDLHHWQRLPLHHGRADPGWSDRTLREFRFGRASQRVLRALASYD